MRPERFGPVGQAVLVLLAVCVFWRPARAQGPIPFAGNLGIYISLRNLSWEPRLTPALAAYVQANDSLGLTEAALKTALAAQLGNDLATALRNAGHPGQIVFLNADPQRGAALKTSLGPDGPQWTAASEALAGLDHVLVLDSLRMETDVRRSFFAVHNRIVSERRYATIATLGMKLVQLPQGKLRAQALATYDDDVRPVHPEAQAVELQARRIPAVAFLNSLLNDCLHNLAP